MLRSISVFVILITVCAGCQQNSQPPPAPPTPPTPPTSPSPRASENGWPQYEDFGGPHAGPGWAGNWGDVPGTPIDAGNVQTVPLPQCGALNVVTAGAVSGVQQPNCPGATPSYQSLCTTGYQRVRNICMALCARTANTPNPCINWQVRPHIYEERGCLGGVTPPSTINVVWRRYCELHEGCVCTFRTD